MRYNLNCFFFVVVFISVYLSLSNSVYLSLSNACNYNQFRCFTSDLCIGTDLVCDGVQNCPDNSDEIYCFFRSNLESRSRLLTGTLAKKKPQTRSYAYIYAQELRESTNCSSDYRVCPGIGCGLDFVFCETHRGCIWEDEEFKCPIECDPDEFRCSPTYCIEKYKVCDGRPNCFNKMDEFNCFGSTLNTADLSPSLVTRYKRFNAVNNGFGRRRRSRKSKRKNRKLTGNGKRRSKGRNLRTTPATSPAPSS